MIKFPTPQPIQPSSQILSRYIFLMVLTYGLAILIVLGHVKAGFIERVMQESNLPAEMLLPETFGNENVIYNHAIKAKDRPKNAYHFLFEMLTDLRFDDMRSLFGSELPGFTIYNTKIFVAGEGMDYTSLPQDNPPPPEISLETPEPLPPAKPSEKNEKLKKTVLIYHTHYWEAYKPANKGKDATMDPGVSVLKGGEKISRILEDNGIGSVHDRQRDWNAGDDAYQKSRIAVKNALKKEPSLDYLIDIHRDSLGRSKTTLERDGVSYARISFIIGEENPNYSANLYLAKQLKNRIDRKQPGLVRGIVGKTKFVGNGVYNQDLSEKAILIELGGVDNTLDEVERSATILAEALSDYIDQQKK
ncbi:stage II sporulation protein P [Sporolactobacillus sp. THM19-2]|uniref:stage II sporulation protein P n=1 Tax=Sporolactobacillus sp. THM19-2 TaxID=2511171 RepID=UPI001F0EC9ED|nr:stage II sporulation protein P [Sporolactobacillus sp. THM19-2]